RLSSAKEPLCDFGCGQSRTIWTRSSWTERSISFKLKPSRTTSRSRSIALHPNEGMLIQLRRRKATRTGRAELRKRVTIEHKLARVECIQGDTARYAGCAKTSSTSTARQQFSTYKRWRDYVL